MTISDALNIVMTLVAIGAVPIAGWGVAIYQRSTGIKLTEQQRAAVLGAARTTAGIIQTKLDQKQLSIRDIHVDDPAIRAEAADAVARVPDSAAALGTTPEAMAAIVVGLVDTTPPLPLAVAPVEVAAAAAPVGRLTKSTR